ncbi:cytochrome-c peroxidase [Microbulbifer hainanensis]|uniref:cytochrome-c peroxidase n=1 Tax=Microbulbifer hainanensis TaxID=2735675 RepID=UPI0018682629|nr:cytochrome-c peroxidase [Microbulbifer hainanensis]
MNISGTEKRISFIHLWAILIALLFFLLSGSGFAQETDQDKALGLLGKHIFFDKHLSSSGQMGCVSCHEPTAGGTGPDPVINATQVAMDNADGEPSLVGRRKPQTNTYASFNLPFALCNIGGAGPEQYCGGNFWDGRALGRPLVSDNPDFPTLPFSAPHIDTEVFYNVDPVREDSFRKFISPISDQALNPMPNPNEQNMSREDVCETVAASPYAWLYELAWGEPLNCSPGVAVYGESYFDISFKRLMMSAGAYQSMKDINSFSSKRDIAIRTELACIDSDFSEYRNSIVCSQVRQMQYKNPDKEYGKFPLVMFTDEENLGHDLFYNIELPAPPFFTRKFPNLPATQCAFCHSDHPETDDGSELLQIYSDQAYHNIGTPGNPLIPKLTGIDTGLNLHTGIANDADGFIRTQTLRNVAKKPNGDFVKAFMHNGFFKSLWSVVHFYNTRDALPRCETIVPFGTIITEAVALANNCWPEPEFPATASPSVGFPLVGRLGLSLEQEKAVAAYIETLSDSHSAEVPLLLDEGTSQYHPVVRMLMQGQLYGQICGMPGASQFGCLSIDEVADMLEEGDWLTDN